MKTKGRNKMIPPTLALLGVFAVGGMTLRAQDQAPPPADASQPAGQRSDGQIEMDVVHALDDSQALKNDLITAATIQSQVTLSGTVASDASRQLAESIAAKVAGVTKVNNNLNVGDPNAAQADQGQGMQDQGAQGQGAQGQAAQDQAAQYPNQQDPNAAQPGYGRQQPQNQPQDQSQAQSQAQQYPQQQQQYPQQQQNSQRQGYPAPPPAYGQQPGYRPPPPGYGQRPQYAPRTQPQFAQANQPMTLGPGTLLQVRTNESLDNKRAKDGQPVDFTVIRDVAVNGMLAIPRGATVHGVVTEVKNAGALSGSPELALRLVSLDLGGKNYPLDSDQFKVRGPSKTGHTAGNIIGGALVGALIGGAAGGGGGAAIGAAAGGTVGTAASAAGPGPRAWIPAEALVTFHLNTPLTVDPISQQEAMRLSQGLNQGGPALYQRGAYRPGYGPYAYPPVYYRPYYIVGGYYYWR